MAYRLTQEDIDRFGLIDAMAGDVATAADLQKMSMATGSPADQLARGAMDFSVPSMPMGEGTVVNRRRLDYPQAASNFLTSPIESDPMIGSEEIAADVFKALGIQGTVRLADQVSPIGIQENEKTVTALKPLTRPSSLLDEPVSQDPFKDLSKSQRTMLAFAAIKDAGMQLQGKEGGAFLGTLQSFRDRADMERKRQIQEQTLALEKAKQDQIQALLTTGVMPSTTVSMGQEVSEIAPSVSLKEQIDQLKSQFGAYASLDQIPAYQVKMDELTSEFEAAQTKEAAEREKIQVSTGKLAEAKSALDAAKRALAASTGLEEDKLVEMLQAEKDIDPSSFFIARQAFVPDSKRFKEFQAATGELEAVMTFQNMAEVIKAGAKLGILSDSDLRLLGRLSGMLDPVNMPKQTAETIVRLYGKLNETIQAIESDLSGGDYLDKKLKEYGL